MKITVDSYLFRNAFERTRPDQFSYAALGRLFDYYDGLDNDSGTETELDVIAICCDWTEYKTFEEAADAYGWDGREEVDDDRADLNERHAEEWLSDQTQVIDCGASVLVLNF